MRSIPNMVYTQLFNFVHIYISPFGLVSHVIFHVNVDLLSPRARILLTICLPLLSRL